MHARLNGKVAIVTGATGALGSAIARLFASEGALLILSGRKVDAGRALVAELRQSDTQADFIAGDVGDESHAIALAARARDLYGRIDALVLNAGILVPGVGPFWSATVEDFETIYRTNVRGPWLAARAAVPLLSNGSSIVIMASISSFIVYKGEALYSATKGAVLQLARGMALDLAEKGVRVNALCPGFCDTPMNEWYIERAADPAAAKAEMHASAPLGRMGTPDEVARAALFLASDDSSYCTGSALVADGGYTIQ